MSDLTELELNLIKLCNSYGVDLDLSGPRIQGSTKAAARELLRKGYLTGTIKALTLTVRGWDAYTTAFPPAKHSGEAQ